MQKTDDLKTKPNLRKKTKRNLNIANFNIIYFLKMRFKWNRICRIADDNALIPKVYI